MDAISQEELMRQIRELKVVAMNAYRSLFDEQIARCVSAIVVDMEDGTILHSTPPANNLFGYINGALNGKNITDLMPERFRKIHAAHLLTYKQSPHRRQMGESQMDLFGLSNDGQEFKIEISLYPTDVINRKCVVATIIKMRH